MADEETPPTASSEGLIATVLGIHGASPNRPANCPMIVWVQEQGDLTPAELRQQLVARPDFGAMSFIDAFQAVANYTQPEKAEAELFYANALKARPERQLLERLLAREAAGMEAATVQILVDALGLVHPNAKALCIDPTVAPNIPASIDLTGVPCLSNVKAHDQDGVLIALQDLVVSGGRDAEPLSTVAEELLQLRREVAQLKAARPTTPSLVDIANLMRAARADPVEP